MQETHWLNREADRSLARLLPRILEAIADHPLKDVFVTRLRQQFPRIFRHLHRLYGEQYDFFYHLEQILLTAARSFATRSEELHELDNRRVDDPLWFQRESMIGGVCYVDLFAGDLDGIRSKIPYFNELNLTYLHLMPLFKVPAQNNDGGYAVSDYRQVDDRLGTMDQLRELAADLRTNGISLTLDFVFNHTSDEHEWAQRALAGEEEFLEFYYMFPDRELPDRYEQNLREIFPEQAPGSFTYRPEVERWVWTTFNTFQWDLNYGNPAVFNAMLNEMLFLANIGTEVLRLDAVAFVWKKLGTPCENLPEVHEIIRAFNALVQIVAPAMLFKSEAIVHPDDVASYIDWEECQISYNPTFMALIWEALATRDVKLLRTSMSKRFALPEKCSWVNYVRVHDDIGWSFADEDAANLWMNGFDHRQFLNQFYTGRFPGSFANGLPFNFNPINQDMRICGTCASLAGLEQGLDLNDDDLIEHALRRIIMIHAVIIAAGGIPLIYLGDEIATPNDYSFRDDPVKAADNRWAHRPQFDWKRAAKRHDPTTPQGRVFDTLRRVIDMRRRTPALADGQTLFFDPGSRHVLGFIRNKTVMVLANFSEQPQEIHRNILAIYWPLPESLCDLIETRPFELEESFTMEPYQILWLAAESSS